MYTIPFIARYRKDHSGDLDEQEVRAIQGQRSDRIAHILGYHYGEEIVHRNNLVLL